jgi:V8-like Glu-specific endopeptidase
MKNTRRSVLISRVSVLVAGLLAVVFGMGGVTRADSTPSKARAPKTGVVSSARDGVKPAATKAWTLGEMLSAKPMPEPKVSLAAIASAKTPALPNGPAGAVGGKQPDALSTLDFNVPPGSYSTYPYSAVGKLYFTQNGWFYVCSASLVKGHAIWTAGHCAHAGNNSSDGWSTDAVFVPQYYHGAAPLGNCYVQEWWTSTDWYANGNPDGLDHDYAGGNVSCDYSNITSYTGYLGLAWNRGYRGTSWTALGYPAAAPYDGSLQIGCSSGTASYGFGSPTTFAIWCDMTGGSSGGPWFRDSSYINGNTSYSVSTQPGKLFSPYYDSTVNSIYSNLWS